MSSTELRLLPSNMVFNAGNVADNWKRFKQKLEFYFAALGGGKVTDKKKVGILMTALGDAGIEVFNSFKEVNEASSYAKVIAAFDSYCNPKRNTVYERFLFSQIVQGSQSVETFIVELKNQARKCEFNEDELDKLVRDRIVVGIANAEVRKQMLRDPELTLESATTLAQVWAKSEMEAAAMSKPVAESALSINRMQSVGRPERRRTSPARTDRKICGNCGYEHYSDRCPAAEKECNYCHKIGHFASMCRRKPSAPRPSTHAVEVETNRASPSTPSTTAAASASEAVDASVKDLEVLQLYAVTRAQSSNAWFAELHVASIPVRFKIDSGAECNTLLSTHLEKLHPSPTLQPTRVRLRPYGGGALIEPIGEIVVPVVANGRKHNVKFFVVEFQNQSAFPVDNILGLPTIEDIGLVHRVFRVNSENDKTPNIFRAYADVFSDNLGNIEGYTKLMVRSNVQPVAEKPRRFPFSLKPKICDALLRLEKLNVIERVVEPTEWVSNLIIVTKPSGGLRICMDPRHLNAALIVPKCEIPRSDDIFAELYNKTYFTVFDLRDGFWQIKWDNESSYLTTFNSPIGRFRWKRLVMGISSAPEIFVNRMRELFGDISGVYPYFDDIIVTGSDEQDHDRTLEMVLQRARKMGVKFNASKVQYKQTSVQYLGFQISNGGVQPLQKHVRAITDMPRPVDRNGILRLLGLVRYLSRFLPNLATNTEALRSLTHKNHPFIWLPQHESEFRNIKTQIQHATDLRFYRPNEPLFVQTDSSKSGVGCCLYQSASPISYASRALSKTEQNYAQIEKELLAVVFALEKFHDYTYGRHVTVHSDHRPLVAIVKKPISELTPRLQRLRLRLLRYNFSLQFQPGKELFIADTLSRAYLTDEPADESYQLLEVHACSNVVATPARVDELVAATNADPDLVALKIYLRGGWPKSRKKLSPALCKFKTFSNNLSFRNNLCYFENRIVVPASLVVSMLRELHSGHLNVHKTKQLARKTLFWLGMSTDIELFVSSCTECNKFRNNNASESLRSFAVPTRPWERLHTDILTYNSVDFLVIYDAYSQWLELFSLRSKSASEIIKHFKSVFARFGVPSHVVSDNIPYNSAEWLSFASAWNFEVLFSSPRYPQANGASEKAVAIAKRILQKNVDLYYALLQYRNAPIPHLGFSPAQLVMSRNLRTRLPATPAYLQPAIADPELVQSRKMRRQTEQKLYFNRGTRDLPPLKTGDEVFYKKDLTDTEWKPGTIVSQGVNPRSYEVRDSVSQARLLRNRRFIRKPARFREPSP